MWETSRWAVSCSGWLKHPFSQGILACVRQCVSSLVFLMLSPDLCRHSEGCHPVLQGHTREDQQGPHGGTLPWSESFCFYSLAVYVLPGKAGLLPLYIDDLRMKQPPIAVTWISPRASCPLGSSKCKSWHWFMPSVEHDHVWDNIPDWFLS